MADPATNNQAHMFFLFYYERQHESTVTVVVYLIFCPIFGFVFMYVWGLILDRCCDQDEHRAQESAGPVQRTVAIAPILTKLPPEFRFANYVNENMSDSVDAPNSVLSLTNAVNLQGLLTKCVPCPRCVKAGRNERSRFEQLFIIPETETRQPSTLNQTTKMADVAKWMGMQEASESRGAALIFDTSHHSDTSITLRFSDRLN